MDKTEAAREVLARDLDRHAASIYQDMAQSHLWSCLIAARDALASPPSPSEGAEKMREDWPSTCDGKEQDAFEAWASAERFDMHTHPLHWLFLNAETAAARKGWKAGLTYAVDAIRAMPIATAPQVQAEGADLAKTKKLE